MKLAVISHKLCWPSDDSPTGYATDGGFPLQMEVISELFDATSVVVPSETAMAAGLTSIKGCGVNVVPLSLPKGHGFSRKLRFPFWLLKNGKLIWRIVRHADAVHAPIPGDIGTIGMLCALIQRKPLFVRHCGDWMVQRTWAERFWKSSMEYFAGGKNVMLVTGGASEAPSERNKNIKWIFSTSLRSEQMQRNICRTLPDDGGLRIVIACRLEPRKGVDVVIQSMQLILKDFPKARLDVVGDGSQLARLRELSSSLGLNNVVRFHGKVEQKAVLDVLKLSHVFCFPTSASEGFPKAVLEALATGLPVVTTRVSVLPELIGRGGGVLIDEPDAMHLSAAVRDICSDRSRYSGMSAKAIETALEYSLEGWQERIGEILRESWGVGRLAESVGH